MTNLPDCQYDYRYETPKAKIVDNCISCGSFIVEGQEYYDIKGMIFCETCMNDFKKVGELE